jgi:hypothetical protein
VQQAAELLVAAPTITGSLDDCLYEHSYVSTIIVSCRPHHHIIAVRLLLKHPSATKHVSCCCAGKWTVQQAAELSVAAPTMILLLHGFILNVHMFQHILVLLSCVGAGKWTVQQAAELSVAAPTITSSLDGRYMSALKDQRVAASKVFGELGLKVGMVSRNYTKGKGRGCGTKLQLGFYQPSAWDQRVWLHPRFLASWGQRQVLSIT